MSIKVDFSAVQEKLDNLSKKMQNEIISEALEAGKKPVLEAMRETVPKDTRKLKDSLGQTSKNASAGKRSIKIGINGDRRVSTYGYVQEYGSCCIVGKHWMKKSFDKSKSEANEEIKKVIKEKLKM